MAHVRSYAPAQPCAYCGAMYRPRRELLKRGSGRFCSHPCANKSRGAVIPADAVIAALYRDDRRTLKEIMEKYGTGIDRIRGILKAEGVELRPTGWKTPGRYRSVYAPNGTRTTEHRLVTQAAAGTVVHHIDGNGRNNDPSNLVAMSRQQHAKTHKQLQEVAFDLVRAGVIRWEDGSYTCSSSLGRLSKHA